MGKEIFTIVCPTKSLKKPLSGLIIDMGRKIASIRTDGDTSRILVDTTEGADGMVEIIFEVT
ncbi:hypothetical protein LCGC14_0717780 [marine sediment metagenome]|uniref:Uncharacterized protein n=1 Tax=marine sediment metagenome TaxID=412755 RepID=A0A0F9QHJ1_9ZZZZ